MPLQTSWPRISPKRSRDDDRIQPVRDRRGGDPQVCLTTQVAGISIATVGVILLVVVAIALIVGLWMIRSGRAAPEL